MANRIWIEGSVCPRGMKAYDENGKRHFKFMIRARNHLHQDIFVIIYCLLPYAVASCEWLNPGDGVFVEGRLIKMTGKKSSGHQLQVEAYVVRKIIWNERHEKELRAPKPEEEQVIVDNQRDNHIPF